MKQIALSSAGWRIRAAETEENSRPVFALFIDSPVAGRAPVRNEGGEVRVFGSEREAQEVIARIGLRKLQAFLDGQEDFDDALTVEEYYLEVRLSRDGLVIAEGA